MVLLLGADEHNQTDLVVVGKDENNSEAAVIIGDDGQPFLSKLDFNILI